MTPSERDVRQLSLKLGQIVIGSPWSVNNTVDSLRVLTKAVQQMQDQIRQVSPTPQSSE